MTEFQNPNQDPGMERRLLLVFAITFVILIAAQPLLMKFAGKKTQPPAATQQQQTTQQTQTQPQAPAPAQPAAVSPARASAPPSSASGPAKVAQNEEETVVENDLYRITFTNKGAQVKSWVLKKYTDDKGKPLDLVNQLAAKSLGYPLSLFTYDQDLRNQLNSAMFVPSVTGQQSAPTSVSFEYSQGDVTARKTFSFDHSYVVNTDITVTRGGQTVAAFPSWPSGFGDDTVEYSYAAQRIDYLPTNQDKVQRLSPDRKGEKIGNLHTVNGPFYWAGALDQYFTATFMPERPDQAAMVQFRNSIEVPRNLDKPDQNLMKVEVLGAAAGNVSAPTRTRIFVGPKDVDVLAKVNASPVPGQTTAPNIEGLVDFGFFGIIARPLFAWLKWTQHYVPNWGWAIVVVTVIINLALLPLRISSMKSALKMQKVQPQVNAIKKKYEKYSMRDPRRQEMNQEIAAVFKEHGANPAGGCLPMILQMPFLFAFYTMLGVAIELRHAPWLWIRDLSAPDPYYVLPVLIVVTTLLMQRMTPNPGMDPAQQKMMNLIMPLMLGWISYRLAAGLGVYWVVGTIIAIVQQQVMNRTELGREMRAEMEKRARKKALKTT